MNDFYILNSGQKRSEVRIHTSAVYDRYHLKIGLFTPEEPFKMHVAEGRKFYDRIDFLDGLNFAISERFYDLLIQHGFTGWKGYRISIEGTDEVYYGFQVLGRCAQLIDPIEKGFYIGYQFEESSWDGSDIFTPEGAAGFFMTPRVVDMLKKYKITNVCWRHISECRVYAIGKGS